MRTSYGAPTLWVGAPAEAGRGLPAVGEAARRLRHEAGWRRYDGGFSPARTAYTAAWVLSDTPSFSMTRCTTFLTVPTL